MKIRDTFLPFSRPSIGASEIKRVTDCLTSGWITTGGLCKEFEDNFCGLTGAKKAVTVSSATAGMHLLLTALNLQPGDEVITPSMTFASTVNMITLQGAVPVFVDVDYPTLNMNCNLIEESITPKTRAIIPVHFAGAPVNMDAINTLAEKYSLIVIEDAAHAIGTYFKGIHSGGFGHPAVFSFHPIKNITTGEGGMVTLHDPELEQQIRLMRFHGIERDAWKRYGKGGNPSYDIAAPGYKYNMPDLLAALGLAQLERWHEFNARRLALAELYLQGLKDMPEIDLPGVPVYDHTHAWHLFIIKVNSIPRDEFMQRLADYNVGYGLHFPPAHKLRYISDQTNEKRNSLPETDRAADRILSLPLFPDMTDSDVHYVCDAIKEIVNHG
ncbi:MAG: aminotransferase class I/II-fold pyridoxal phosphate-dependent enzyme [Smithellaceae bacterium]